MDIRLEALESLHLTELQSRVYLATLELGQGTVQAIAQKSGVIRSSVYNQLAHLKSHKLVQYVRKGKRALYNAVGPEQVLEQERTRLHAFEQTLPQLLAVFNASAAKPKLMYFEGLEGIKTVYRDVLKTGQPYYGISDFENSIKALRNYFETTYIPGRIRHHVMANFIVRDSPAARAWVKNDVRDMRQTKLIPYSDFSVEVGVYGHKVILINFRSSPPVAVKIEDAAIAGTIQVMWQQLWDRLP